MGHQHRVLPAELEKPLQGLRLLGSALHHLVGDGGQLGDLLWNGPLRVHKDVEPVRNLPIVQAHRADFRNAVILGRKTGGLQVKTDEVLIQGLPAVPGNRRHQVVDEIGLCAIQDLEFRVLLSDGLHRVHGLGKGLGHAVVGDGHSLLPPLVGLLD